MFSPERASSCFTVRIVREGEFSSSSSFGPLCLAIPSSTCLCPPTFYHKQQGESRRHLQRFASGLLSWCPGVLSDQQRAVHPVPHHCATRTALLPCAATRLSLLPGSSPEAPVMFIFLPRVFSRQSGFFYSVTSHLFLLSPLLSSKAFPTL